MLIPACRSEGVSARGLEGAHRTPQIGLKNVNFLLFLVHFCSSSSLILVIRTSFWAFFGVPGYQQCVLGVPAAGLEGTRSVLWEYPQRVLEVPTTV